MIVIKKAIPMPAFQLGTYSLLEQQLIKSGILLPLPNGMWRIKTRETAGEGEVAQTGDYIKLDTIGMPYPTEKKWFEENHIPGEGGMYLQKGVSKKAWCMQEPLCPEIQFLLDRGLLKMDGEHGFRAHLWGTEQTASPDAVVVLDQVDTDSCGEILSVDFHFVAAEEFVAAYDILRDG